VPAMNKEEILSKISVYIEEYFEVPRSTITMEANLYQDLGLDSIDAVDLIVKLQELTNKKISPESFKTVRTVSDLVDKLAELINE
jgi:acyl carrier protein